MKPHKWAKEIKAWADGAEIEWALFYKPNEWLTCNNQPSWGNDNLQFRIKPQPKEPQYLYLYNMLYGKKKMVVGQWFYNNKIEPNEFQQYVGKIKIEQE